MSTPLGRAARTMIKRVRGDHLLRRSERALVRKLAVTHGAIQTEITALSVQVDGIAAKREAGPLAAAEPSVRALFDDPQPQLVPGAVSFVAARLSPELTVLEWGGGASTPFLCERVGVLHTVEASPEWALVLLDYMRHRLDLIDRWRFHYVGANWTSVRAVRRRTGRSLPEPAVRRRLEGDYALMITDPVDAIFVDGAVRQRTLAAVAEYVTRDRPGLVVVNAMDSQFVAEAMRKVDMSGYDRQDFWGLINSLDGDSIARCTSVWVRRSGVIEVDQGPSADDQAAVHGAITTVWEGHDDEAYRQDQSHWRGVGRWDEGAWTDLGRATTQRLEELHHAAHRGWSTATPPVLLEWGPGGGANLYALADRVGIMYGVDISAKNLDETARVLSEKPGTEFIPVLLDGEPSTVVAAIDRPVDLFVSTAVFQHFPSPEYGAEVLRAVRQVMAEGGLGYVQVRFDDGTERYRSKTLTEYRERHITATSYQLSDFWSLLADAGFRPLVITNVNGAVNYAGFYFACR